MASNDREVFDALLQTVVALAEKAKESANAEVAERFASASRQVAEAVAWLKNPEQPH